MRLARVLGKVVSTVKSDGFSRYALLLVEDVEAATAAGGGRDPYVAVDFLGAGQDELVLVTSGSAARLPGGTPEVPTDWAIVGIVDSVEYRGKTTFTK